MDAVFEKIEFLFKNEKYTDALALCLSTLLVQPENFGLHKKLISIYSKLSEFDKALEACNVFISYFPQQLAPYLFRCHCYLDLQQFELADADCRKILQLGEELKNDYYKDMALLLRAYIAYTDRQLELAQCYLEDVETDCLVVAGKAMFTKHLLLKKIASIQDKTKSSE